MNVIASLIGLFDHLIDAGEIMIFGMIAAIVGISILPKDNPLHALLVTLTKHLAATLAIGIIALPLQPIPGIDVAYDTGSMLFLLYYWGSFVYELLSDKSPLRRHGPVVDGEATETRPGHLSPRQASPAAPKHRAPAPVIDVKAWNPLSDFERRH